MKGLRGLAWLLIFQSIGELLSRGFSLPLPGPVLGLVLRLAFGALQQRVLVGQGGDVHGGDTLSRPA